VSRSSGGNLKLAAVSATFSVFYHPSFAARIEIVLSTWSKIKLVEKNVFFHFRLGCPSFLFKNILSAHPGCS
jgi:hypothetical protein